MADPFQPRFVDLVRNYTTTQGTGNFVLGPVVNGFTGFGSALQIGDSFYYSAIGVDKPTEREVGRGTLQSNGSISRSPIYGPLTNFSSGTKSIALIAAAEWFNTVQASSGGTPPVVAADRAAIASATSHQVPALLIENGREGLFAFSSANLSAQVTADPNQGIYVAPASTPTGASGAWVRKFDGPANAQWWGFLPGVGDVSAALLAARDTLVTHALAGFGYGKAGPALYIPPSPYGTYNMGSTTLDLVNAAMRLFSDGGPRGGGAVLQWSGNVTGIRVQAAGTNGATATGGLNAGAQGSEICGLTLIGAFTTAESEAHAIHVRTHTRIHDMMIRGWAGDGLYGKNDIIDELSLADILFEQCRNGYYLEGTDTNAITVDNVHTSSNRRYGYWLKLGLGVVIKGGNSSTNGAVGIGGTIPFTMCSNGTNRYYVLPNQDAAASTTAPPAGATNNAVWGWFGAGGPANEFPLWATGTQTFRAGGHGRIEGSFQQCVLVDVYHEPDQAPLQVDPNAQVLGLGSLTGAPVLFNGLAYGAWLTGSSQGITASGKLTAKGDLTAIIASVTAFRVDAAGAHLWTPLFIAPDVGAVLEVGRVSNGVNAIIRPDSTAPALELRSPDNSTSLVLTNTTAAFTDALSAPNLSGTNTGDQTITLTGDVSGSGSSSFSATISAGSVSLPKMANLAANSLIGNNTGSSATPAALTAAQTRSLLGLAAIATSGSGADLGGASVTFAKVQNVSATSKLLGRASAGAGVIEELGLAGGLTISSTNLSLGAITPTGVASTGAVTSSSATSGNGYVAGAGGTVTQATSKSTGVTLNKVCGQITMNGAALAAATSVGFTLTNSAVAATDVVMVNIASTATADSYQATVDAVAAGSCRVSLRNISAASKSEAVVLNFAVCKAVNA